MHPPSLRPVDPTSAKGPTSADGSTNAGLTSAGIDERRSDDCGKSDERRSDDCGKSDECEGPTSVGVSHQRDDRDGLPPDPGVDPA